MNKNNFFEAKFVSGAITDPAPLKALRQMLVRESGRDYYPTNATESRCVGEHLLFIAIILQAVEDLFDYKEEIRSDALAYFNEEDKDEDKPEDDDAFTWHLSCVEINKAKALKYIQLTIDYCVNNNIRPYMGHKGYLSSLDTEWD